MVERVPSVPKVAIKVQPKFFLLNSSISSLKFCPRSSLIFLIMIGLLLGHKSKSISPNSTRSLFKSRYPPFLMAQTISYSLNIFY